MKERTSTDIFAVGDMSIADLSMAMSAVGPSRSSWLLQITARLIEFDDYNHNNNQFELSI